MKKVFVLGSVNIDFVMNADRMPKEGETMHGESFMINEGGKGANQAVASSKIGAATYMIGYVGGDALAEHTAARLREYGVHTQFLKKDETVSTGAAQITVIKGNNRIILSAGANYSIKKEDIDEALSTASAGDIFIAQNEIQFEITTYGLQSAYERGLITIFNPAPAATIPESFFRFVRILIVNEVEAVQLTGKADLCAAVGKLLQFPCEETIVTLGEAGCLFLKGDIRYIPAVPVKAVDSTAAGDTFIGVVGGMLACGCAAEEALSYAVVASALAVTKTGAQCSIPTKEEVNRFMERLQTPVRSKVVSIDELEAVVS